MAIESSLVSDLADHVRVCRMWSWRVLMSQRARVNGGLWMRQIDMSFGRGMSFESVRLGMKPELVSEDATGGGTALGTGCSRESASFLYTPGASVSLRLEGLEDDLNLCFLQTRS